MCLTISDAISSLKFNEQSNAKVDAHPIQMQQTSNENSARAPFSVHNRIDNTQWR